MYGRGFGFLLFAILLVILIAECVASKGSFFGVRRIVVLLILISSAVFATAQFRYTLVEENRDSYMQYMTDEKSVIVWGKIYKTEYKYFSYRYYMTDCVVQPRYGKAFGRKISCGDVVVYCDSKSAHMGDYMKANGRIGLFKSATNEGEFDRARFYRSQGIDFSVNADSIKTSAGKHAWYYHRLEKLRDTLSASLLEVTDETTAGVLSSMLLGDKSYLDDEIKDLYRVSGISHILAISGVKTLKLDIPLVPKTRINWAVVPLHIAIIYILKLCLDEEIIPRCRFPCSRGVSQKIYKLAKEVIIQRKLILLQKSNKSAKGEEAYGI